MKAPIITWTEAYDEQIISNWDMGKVNAGDYAGARHFHIWNNYKGTEDVADMQEVQITTVSPLTGDDLDIIKEHWVQVRSNSMGKHDTQIDQNFYPIGGTQTHSLTAEGQENGVIKGTANSGVSADIANYVDVTLDCKVPVNASAGTRSISTRVIYYYI